MTQKKKKKGGDVVKTEMLTESERWNAMNQQTDSQCTVGFIAPVLAIYNL